MPFCLKGTKGQNFFLKDRACMVAGVLEASRQPFAVLIEPTIAAFAVLCASVKLVELGCSVAFWLGCLWNCFRSR